MGRLGRVVHIDDDGDVSVTVADGQYLFSPVCLEVVDPNSLLAREKVPSVPNNLHSLKCKTLYKHSPISTNVISAQKVVGSFNFHVIWSFR